MMKTTSAMPSVTTAVLNAVARAPGRSTSGGVSPCPCLSSLIRLPRAPRASLAELWPAAMLPSVQFDTHRHRLERRGLAAGIHGGANENVGFGEIGQRRAAR